jgi:hypothetical protein
MFSRRYRLLRSSCGDCAILGPTALYSRLYRTCWQQRACAKVEARTPDSTTSASKNAFLPTRDGEATRIAPRRTILETLQTICRQDCVRMCMRLLLTLLAVSPRCEMAYKVNGHLPSFEVRRKTDIEFFCKRLPRKRRTTGA